jgi:hypothetical protein
MIDMIGIHTYNGKINQFCTLGTAAYVALSIYTKAVPLTHIVMTVALAAFADAVMRKAIDEGFDRFIKPKLMLCQPFQEILWNRIKFSCIKLPMTPTVTLVALKVVACFSKSIIPLPLNPFLWRSVMAMSTIAFLCSCSILVGKRNVFLKEASYAAHYTDSTSSTLWTLPGVGHYVSDRPMTLDQRLSDLKGGEAAEIQLMQNIKEKIEEQFPAGQCEIGEPFTELYIASEPRNNAPMAVQPAIKRTFPLTISFQSKLVLTSTAILTHLLACHSGWKVVVNITDFQPISKTQQDAEGSSQIINL